MSELPPGPTEPPLLQTIRWLMRPIAFLESCRRRFGDAFSVQFLGFETPMVMISHPDAIKALYGVREHGLPPGRTLALLPVVGSRSLLLLEGSDHIARRRLMLPPFHGERMRAYEEIVRDAVARDLAGWPVGRPFALHPHMQAVTLDVILRAVFGVTDETRRTRLAGRLAGLLGSTASPRLQFGVLVSRRIGGSRGSRRSRARSTNCSRRRSPSAARTRARTSCRCSSKPASTTAARWTTARFATS
jgi:cytochrome P450